jgi:ATP-dependent helicase HrpB
VELDAIDADGRVTAHGEHMARLATHPRLAHMILRAIPLGLDTTACDLAALLGERDVLRSERAGSEADLRLRLEALRDDARSALAIDRDALRRVRAESAALRRALRIDDAHVEVERSGVLLALAYPDRIAQRRPGERGRYLLRNGGGAAFAEPQLLSESAYVVAAELDGKRPESRIFLAAPLDEAELLEHFGAQIQRERVIAWDEDARAVAARERDRLGAIVLRDVPLRDPDPALVTRALLDGLMREGIQALPWSERARRLRERLAFLHRLDARWPDVSDEALASTVGEWLAQRLVGARTREDVARADIGAALEEMLTREQRRALDEDAPTHFEAPSGSRIPIDYADPDAPVLAVRLQEMFGLAETPRVARGRVPLTLHLLSPAQRPVQVTRDLAGFWRGSYFDVRKDLRGRYPKHHWPDDPLAAAPTARAKRRS